MKRTISDFAIRMVAFLLSVILLSGCAGPVGAAAAEAGPTKITNLQITTAGKAKFLELSWKKQSAAQGYQIYRSSSGKAGTYERVAVVKKAAYADKGLKNAATYYYKVRAYAKANGRNIYGPFAKVNLSTRITKAYAEKLSRRVYNVAYDWLHQFWFDWDYDRCYEKPISEKYTGAPELLWIYGENARFYKLNHPTIKTMKQLKAYLMKTFSKDIVDEITKNYYREENGTLYRIESITGDELAVLFPSKNKVRFSNISDKRIDIILYIETMEYDYDRDENITKVIPLEESLYYQNGRWVFGENVEGYTWNYGMWFLFGETMGD